MIRSLFAFLCLTFFAVLGYASTNNDLSNLLNSVRTMRANFTQTSYDNHGKAVQQSFGRMALQRPGKFRWDVKKPIPQLIIANQSRLWIYDADLEQVTIKSLKKGVGETPALLLSDEHAFLDKDFNTKAKLSGSSQWFILTPKKRDSMYSTIRIEFANKQLHEMQLIDQLGHATKIKFEQIETNINLPSSLFTFKTPAKIDVIDETRKR